MNKLMNIIIMSSILWTIIIDILYYLPSKTIEQLNYKDFTQLT